ncbi:hypothetical protein [Burkholderia alba]|uniref:hypothetical protein n=1 Tax=Burkholderia alba TaxID=2683677 RepID=UPI002B054E37|nr:hypothetical protein [Burkholderia alba]
MRKASTAAADALNAYFDSDDEPEDDARREQLEEAAALTEQAADDYEAQLESWSDEQKANAGVIVTLDYTGALKIERGLVKPQDRAAAKDAGLKGAETFPPAKVKPLHGETLCERLTAHRTAAVQVELMKQPTVALAYLMVAMVPRVFDEQCSVWPTTHALDVQFNSTHDRLLRLADDMADSRAWQFINGEREKWRAMLPAKFSDLLPWLLSCPETVLADLFAFCVAATVDGLSRRDAPHTVNVLADTLGVDMTAYWKPTGASYLNHVPKQRILDVVAQAVSPEAAAPLAGMKKPEAVAAAELRLADLGWLPEVLANRETTAIWQDDEEVDADVEENADKGAAMQIRCRVRRERYVQQDRAGRPYVFELVHYADEVTGRIVRTKGHIVPILPPTLRWNAFSRT